MGRLAGPRLPRGSLGHSEFYAYWPLYIRPGGRRGTCRAIRHSGCACPDRHIYACWRFLRNRRHTRGGATWPGNAQIGNGRLFTTVTAVVVGGTALSGGQGGVLQTFVGVLIVSVLSNGMVLMGVPPSMQIGFQGLMIIAAVSLSIDRKLMRIVK